MKQILCLSNEPWSSSPGRTQQLISRLRDTQVLYFSPARRGPGQDGRKVRPNVTAYSLPPLLPVPERCAPLFQLERRRLGRFIAGRAARHRFRAPLLWTTSPEHVHLLDHLSYDGLVYDCDREWEGLPPIWEGSLAQAADVVFAASPQLRDRLSPCSSNIALLPNGVNYPLFSGQGNAARPDPIPRARGPLLGWTGTIRPDLDLSPLLYAALARPDWTFVLIGREVAGVNLQTLHALPNIRFLGLRPNEALPGYLAHFDACLNLFDASPLSKDVSPLKFYEYLATGKPIVSTPQPAQVLQYSSIIHVAHTPEAFIAACEACLQDDGAQQARMDAGRAASWDSRVEEMCHILKEKGIWK